VKILSFNTGYFLDYDGTHSDYLKRPWKGLLGSKKEMANLDKFCELVDSVDPDAVLTQEVDGGSMRSSLKGQQNYLYEKLDTFDSAFHSKYRGKLFPRLPMLRFMGNSVFFRNGQIENHELSIGRKNLVQELKVDDISIFSLHLSTFGGWVRRRQVEEIHKLAQGRDDYVLAGDLNFHKGRREINYLEKLLGQKVHSPGETFPAKNPNRKLDLVTASEGLEVKNIQRLQKTFSDHRPILFEIEKT
jgi:endonuclease/exonuclease/phosphatase family metal-dependent hydrolase